MNKEKLEQVTEKAIALSEKAEKHYKSMYGDKNAFKAGFILGYSLGEGEGLKEALEALQGSMEES